MLTSILFVLLAVVLLATMPPAAAWTGDVTDVVPAEVWEGARSEEEMHGDATSETGWSCATA